MDYKKDKKEQHGIGIENVKEIVNKQNGDMQIWTQNKKFYVSVILYLD